MKTTPFLRGSSRTTVFRQSLRRVCFLLTSFFCGLLLWHAPLSRADDSALLESAIHNLSPTQLRLSPGDNPGEIKAEWDGDGWLQTANDPGGPWEDVEGGNHSPAILQLNELGRYVRLHMASFFDVFTEITVDDQKAGVAPVPVVTIVPVAATTCPATVTVCPPKATACPPTATKCPALPTQCPAQETGCPATHTVCPAVLTQCPAVETQCPTFQTICPPVDTRCPVVDTRCPVIQTQCPPQPTICHVADTVCPASSTRCPPDCRECPRP